MGRIVALVLACAVASSPSFAESSTDYERFGAIGGTEGKPFSFDELRKLLGEAKGIGLIAKLKLRSSLTEFTNDFKRFHQGDAAKDLFKLQTRFNALHARIVELLSSRNPQLSSRFEDARGALWHIYRDPDVFSRTIGLDLAKEQAGAPKPKTKNTTAETLEITGSNR